MRFLHIADVHLDAPFATRSRDLRDRLRSASRDALRNAVDFAVDEELDAVLIAGDLFDGDRISFETETFLLDQFERLTEADVAVVYATGNHDAGRGGGRGPGLPWPAGVTVLAERRPSRVPVRGRGGEPVGWVTAAGHESPRETMDLARTFPRPVGELPEVALLHTQVHGARAAAAHHAYAPSELRHLVRSGFHYWALGHVHAPQSLSDTPPIHYSGSLQGRTSAETGPRGGLLVELTRPDQPRVTFHPFAPVRWERVAVGDLEGARSVAALVDRVRSAWREAREEDPDPGCEGWLVRVELRGASPLWRELEEEEDRRHLAREISDALDALDVELATGSVHPPVDPDRHRGRQDVLGEALRLLDDVRNGRAALQGSGPGELAAAETAKNFDPGPYSRELLEGAEAELLARILDPDALEEAEREYMAEPGDAGPERPASSGERGR